MLVLRPVVHAPQHRFVVMDGQIRGLRPKPHLLTYHCGLPYCQYSKWSPCFCCCWQKTMCATGCQATQNISKCGACDLTSHICSTKACDVPGQHMPRIASSGMHSLQHLALLCVWRDGRQGQGVGACSCKMCNRRTMGWASAERRSWWGGSRAP